MNRMDNSIKITLIIVGAVLVLALIGVFVFFRVLPTDTISASGQAQIKAVPDLVSIYFNVETNGSNAKEAKDKNSEISDEIISALIKLGFEREKITTENFYIYENYDWSSGTQKFLGYKATHNIKIEFSANETDKIGEVIDAGVDAGALISYINFELSLEEQNKYKAEALKLATEDARVKAESIATGLGKNLGRIYSVSNSDFSYYPWTIYQNDARVAGGEEAKSVTTSIQPGEQEINAYVSVVYKIK